MTRCLNCGNISNSIFCDNCNKIIQEQIEKPNFQKFHEKFDNHKVWKCENGTYVRSQGERTIYDFLYKNNIPFEYEPERRYGEYNIETQKITGKLLVPDFYIKGPINFCNKTLENIYIEFWGKNDKNYLTRKENKIKVYKFHKSTLINIYLTDLHDYKNALTYKLTNFKYNQINY